LFRPELAQPNRNNNDHDAWDVETPAPEQPLDDPDATLMRDTTVNDNDDNLFEHQFYLLYQCQDGVNLQRQE
jgi:hypothetical protein